MLDKMDHVMNQTEEVNQVAKEAVEEKKRECHSRVQAKEMRRTLVEKCVQEITAVQFMPQERIQERIVE